MSVGIECPVCEADFLVKEVSEKTGIRCPKCKRKFRYSEEILANKTPSQAATKSATEPTSETKAGKKPLASSTAANESKPAADKTNTAVSEASTKKRQHSKKKSKWKTGVTQAPRLQTVKPVPNSDPHSSTSATSGSASSIALDQLSADTKSSQLSGKFELHKSKSDIESDNLAAIHARKKEKARRQTIYTTVTIAILSITTAVMGFLLYRQLNMPVDSLAGQTASADPSKQDSNNAAPSPLLLDPLPKDLSDDRPSTFGDPQPDEPDVDELPVELPRVFARDLPEREFEFLRKFELRKLWQRIRPRLISLEVRTDLGVEQSVGTIVDSRGWALTSNQLVGKWPEVSATASARDIDAYYSDVDARNQTDDQSDDKPAGQTLLTDFSKGIASAQPKRDQTLLALNTRFVVALDKFEFAPRKRIIGGVYLVQAAPPCPTNPYGYEEVEVLERQESKDLETEARNKAEALGIDDPLLTWIVTTKKGNPYVGTPVFTRTGQMAGTYSFSTKQFAYFVMTDKAPTLIAQAAQSSEQQGKPRQVDQPTELLAESHPMARPSELLNRAGVACQAFGWIPSDVDQYKQLQQFSRRFSTVAKFIRDNQDDESESASLSILSDQEKRWHSSLSESIRDSLKQAPQKISQLNVIAIDKLASRNPNTANTYIPFVAEFYKIGIDENNQDAALMTINQDLAVIKVPYSPKNRMRPGTQWLCFYQRPSELTRSSIKLRSGLIAPLYDEGKILTVLGPIEKR